MRLFRSVVFWIHLALGCVAGLVILSMAITGMALAFERQINAWADAPAVLEIQPDPSPTAKLDLVLALLRNDGQGVPTQLVLHSDRKVPLEAHFGRDRTLLLNPWTGEVIGQPSETTRAFFGAMERFHRSLGLGMQSALGRGLTGAANLAFLFMLLSGIYLWVPKLFSTASLKSRLIFRGRLHGRAREWNWHNVIGIWTAIPLLFIVVTGVIISYPWASNLLYKMTGTQPPANGWRGDRGPRGNVANRLDLGEGSSNQFQTLDELAGVARQQAAQWNSLTIEVPEARDRNLNVSVDKSIGGQPEQVTQLVINRRSGHVDAVKRFSDNNTGRKLRAWARFLHTGEEFGVVGEAIAALACLGAVLLVWTGLSMAVRRAWKAARRQTAKGRSAEKELTVTV